MSNELYENKVITYISNCIRFVFTLGMIMFGLQTNAAEYNGTTGSVKWNLDTETGILRIYGVGEMGNYRGNWDYGYNGNGYAPWKSICTKYNNRGNCSQTTDFSSSIKTVQIEEGVTSIGAAAFYQCSNLTEVIIPNSLTTISYEAFRGCSSLQEINIPAGVSSIQDRWVTDCGNLKYINVVDDNSYYKDIQGILYTKDGTTIVKFPDDNPTTQYNVPEGVTALATDAIYAQKHVVNVILPTSLKNIKYGNFDSCNNLVSFTLKDCDPPTLEKENITSSNLKYVYVPCDCKNNFVMSTSWIGTKTYWGKLSANLFNERNLADVYPFTNDPELGSATVGALPNCNQEPIVQLQATRTSIGVFDHWEVEYIENGIKVRDGENYGTNPTLNLNVGGTSGVWNVTAIFKPVKHTVTLSKCGTETNFIISGAGSFDHGTKVTISASGFPAGRVFDKWTECGKTITVSTSNPYEFELTNDVCYCAHIKVGKNKLTVQTANSSMGTTNPSYTNEELDYGTTVNISANPNNGYEFYQWREDGNTEAQRTITVTSDATYTAVFRKKTYKITAVPNDPSLGSCSGSATVDFQDNVTITATAVDDPCVHFVRWDDWNTNNPRTVQATESKTYTAIFERYSYHVEANAYYGGSATATQNGADVNYQNVACGSEVILEAAPQECFRFINWSDGNTENPRTIIVDKEYRLQATFEQIKPTVIAVSNDNNFGTVSIKNQWNGDFTSGSQVNNCGDRLIITATPKNSCYELEKWSDETTELVKTIDVRTDVNLTAIFRQKDVHITASSNDESLGTVAISGTNSCGNTVTITATPKACSDFVQWNDGNTNKERTVEVTENQNFVATFTNASNFTLTCKDYSFLKEDAGSGNATVTFPLPEVSVGTVGSYSWSVSNGLNVSSSNVTGTLPFGENSVTITATKCGHSESCTTTVKLLKSVPPCEK